jgi:hypothetical protein
MSQGSPKKVPSLLLGANMAETRENSILQAADRAIPEVFPVRDEMASDDGTLPA